MRIKSQRVFIAGVLMPACVQIENGKIAGVLPYETEADEDYGDKRIVPGFIDVHCHGAYGYDTCNPDPEGLKKWAAGIVREGVTGFLATTMTQTKPVLLNALKNVRDVALENPVGAEIIGVHMEGPYIDSAHKGAQPEEAIAAPSVKEFKEYREASGNLVKIITMAIEHDPGYELTRYASQNGVIVSMGHTSATYEQALMAVANGAASITHTYNAMTPFNHRQNGMVGLALRLPDLYSEIICDGHHSTPDALHIFFNAKSRNRCIMITDALLCKGFKTGERFDFEGQEIEIQPDGTAHIIASGTIAGSTLKMNEGLKVLVEKAGITFDKALNACTLNPAEMLKIADRKGKIAPGNDADIVVLNDDYTVETTFCRGLKQF